MKHIKKAFLKTLSVCMIAVICLGSASCSLFEKSEAEKENDFIKSIGGVSETYVGSVSTVTYNTPEKAAQAYVSEQVVGNKQASVVNTRSLSELSKQEVNAMNLPKDIQDGIVSVQEMEVEYSTQEIVRTSTNNTNNKVKVYVIKYENDWKYYTPAPITGETISKDYYDSVFNYEKYKNCTFSSSFEIDMTMMLVVNTKMSMTQVIKYNENKIYIEQTITTSSLNEKSEESIYVYLEMLENGYECYAKATENNMRWENVELYQVGFNSVEELTPFYDQYLDYTYFTKTNFGFQMSDANARQYMIESLNKESSLGDYIQELDKNMDMDMFVKYYVSNGVLSGIREDASFSINLDDIQMDIEIVAQSSCTNYGSTVITKPF